MFADLFKREVSRRRKGKSDEAQSSWPRQKARQSLPSAPKQGQTPDSSIARPTVRKRQTDPAVATIAHFHPGFQMGLPHGRKYFATAWARRKNNDPCISAHRHTSTSSMAFGARSWMKANRASGFDPIRRSTVSAVAAMSVATTATRSRERLAGSI